MPFHNRVIALTHVEPVIQRYLCALLLPSQLFPFLIRADDYCYTKAELCAGPSVLFLVCLHVSLDTVDLGCPHKQTLPFITPMLQLLKSISGGSTHGDNLAAEPV